MKNIVKRALNILPIWAAIVLLDWGFVFISEGRTSDGLFFGIGIVTVTLVINYVIFGAITLWHKFGKET
ncbi:MAG: hypothetical protein ACK5BY_12175 [Limnohabitans sp.]|jgi:hypothetical protein|uniref:hypothetical protein n=1 Tax=Limnohabitans sp. TaxID=1907725 RepID=UPI003918E5E6